MSRYTESVTKMEGRHAGIRLGFGGAVILAAMAYGLLGYGPKEADAQTQTKPRIEFFEGNRGTQDLLGKVDVIYGKQYNLKHRSRPIPNDEARSMVLTNVPPGTVIRLFDSPSGSFNDDYAFITVLELQQKIVINSFEHKQDFIRGIRQNGKLVAALDGVYVNGLDGKVSRIEITQVSKEDVDQLIKDLATGTHVQGLTAKSKVKKR